MRTRVIMRYIASTTTFAILLFLSAQASAMKLITENYEITIDSKCREGEVVCDNYFYTGVSKKTGKSIHLKGSSWHTKLADGTPNRFLGYKFESGNIVYYVSQDGTLEVVQNRDKVLVSERGKWQE